MHPKKSIGLWAALFGAFAIAGACTEEQKAATPTPVQQADQDEQVPRGDDECCTEPGAVFPCWKKDAEDDGVWPTAASDCPSGTWQATSDGTGSHLCVCTTDDDCNDGICYYEHPTDSTGLCGPSYCNGFQVCNCYAGCIAGGDQTPEESCASNFGLNCCEGNYPHYPGETSDVGFGYCSDDSTCGGGCTSDADCVDDTNVCTTPHCNVGTGVCSLENNTVACNSDSDGCTPDDTCAGGFCVPGTVVSCDDHNLCTNDACDSTGNNSYTCQNVNNTLPCNSDSDGCTVDDTCAGGACVAGALMTCVGSDTNVCTDESCDNLGPNSYDCVHDFNIDSCDDGNACTNGDVCALGSCHGTSFPVDDGNPCTDDSCDTDSGPVHAIDITNPCTDSNACTSGDACNAAGACVGVAFSLDDGNQCTDDTCNPLTGPAHTIDVTNVCTDSSACTSGDHCTAAGACVGTAVTCGDSNQCTDDTCNPATGCVYTNDNTNVCSDSSACTSGDHCSAGACVTTPVVCNDSNQCTDDSCNPASGCVYSIDITNVCTDSSLCTSADHCNAAGACVGTAVTCNDSNQCTDDSCAPATGCVYSIDVTNVCTDSSACTSADHCNAAGSCVGTAVTCNDSNTCTTDTCAPATGCVYTNNTIACNDSSACTSGDVCAGGVCAGAAITCNDSKLCTTDTCNPATGCVFTNNTVACNDSNACTSGDVCAGGSCAGTLITCNDSNTCTNDSCNVATGCVYTNNTSACNADGSGCTQNDTCSGGACVAGAAPNCNDSNVCTNDSCSSTGVNTYSCLHANNTVACDDGLWCTDNDHCSGGTCTNTVAHSCGVNTTCTTYSCNEATDSCNTTYTTAACNDGVPCTTGDVCSGGVCAGTPNTCNDGNICTTDACTAGTGACTHTAIAGCCLSDADCTSACPASANTTCNLEYCDTATTHQCVCDPTYGFDHGLPCALDTAVYPTNCYSGTCSITGTCDPVQITTSGSDLCRTMFTTGDITTLDQSKPSYLGWFANTDTLGHLVGGGTSAKLQRSGSTECENNNYEATGKSCKEEGAAALSGTNLGTSGKDAVFVFEYQVNNNTQYQLYSYQIEVQASFNVGIYLKTNIDTADQCPEGVSESPTGHYTVPSNRCYVAYSGAKAVIEDRCMDGNATVSPVQSCCNPLRGSGVPGTVTCSGSTGTAPRGYYWCYRPYPAGCCNYTNGEYCDGSASDGGTKCTGSYWTYPSDPYDSTCTNDNATFPTTNLAQATVYPDGATDGSWRKVFVFVDGVNFASAGGGLEGDFYITVKKQAWNAGPCDRTNDDMRLFDVTDVDYTGATYLGTLANVVNSLHSAGGSCGGYSCANSWSGTTGCHGAGAANEFWPNTETFMISRAVGTGSQTYCFQTDESMAGAADIVISAEEVDPADKSICSATVADLGCDHTAGTGAAGGISTEFTADEGITYQVNLSSYAKLDRPCGAQAVYGCLYKLKVSKGSCPPTCAGGPNETPKGTFTIADPAYGTVSFNGQNLAAGDNNNYSTCSSRSDETWTIINTSTTAVTATITVTPTAAWDPIASLYNCANANITCKDSGGSGTAETFTATIMPGYNYYLVVDSYSSYGNYNVTVTWGSPPLTCVAPNAWTQSPAYFGGIRNSASPITITAGSISPSTYTANSCSASAPDLAGNYSGFSSGYDDLLQINVTANRTISFSGCPEEGATGAVFDSVFALYDCSGKLIASNDDGCADSGWSVSYDSCMRSVSLLASRSPYYMLIDGYDSGDCGNYGVYIH